MQRQIENQSPPPERQETNRLTLPFYEGITFQKREQLPQMEQNRFITEISPKMTHKTIVLFASALIAAILLISFLFGIIDEWQTKNYIPNAIINIPYSQQDYLPLPITLARLNTENQNIADVLYNQVEVRRNREEFQKRREDLINSNIKKMQLFLLKYNLALNQHAEKEGIEMNVGEWQRLNNRYHFEKTPQELPMCIIVPGYNNNANFRIEYNLNSIFTQNYTNYKVIVINDASNDGSDQIYRKYFAFHRIDKQRYVYIKNRRRITALKNIYYASLNYCLAESIVVTVDADDELVGRNTLQLFNWAYQARRDGVVYSNYIILQHLSKIDYGNNSDYTYKEKKENAFRQSYPRFSQLRTFRMELLYQIDPKDLQDEEGNFLTITYDLALFFPLLELSCGKVSIIEGQFNYLYNMGTGLNDYQNRSRQIQVDLKIRARKKYECYKPFEIKMSQV